jgi:hypothetical protein
LIQIVQDKNKPELEGKIMIFKFGKKLNDMIEAQLQPEYGDPCNPYDLFEGREFAVSVRKVGEWNNYDLCSFVGEKTSIRVNGVGMKKNQDDMKTILDYLNEGPKNLTSFDYKDWDDDMNDKVMNVIKNTIPEQRVINEIMGGVSAAKSTPAPAAKSSTSDLYSEVSQTKVSGHVEKAEAPAQSSSSSSSSLEDLYSDL